MAVYKRSYRAYAGALSPEWSRFLVLTRYSIAELFEMRMFTAQLVAAFIPVLVFMAGIYITNSETARAVLQMGDKSFFTVNNEYFLTYLQVQGMVAMLFTAWVCPSLVTADLSNNALPLFLSRPLNRMQYVLGKFLVMFLFLSAMTWVPGLLLFLLQWQMGPEGWLQANWFIAPAVVGGGVLWISMLSLLALAVSAWVKWRVLASGMVLALMFLPAGFGEAINQALRTHWGTLFNLPMDLWLIWRHLLRLPVVVVYSQGNVREVPVEFPLVVLLALAIMSFYMLNKRLVAREVVRG